MAKVMSSITEKLAIIDLLLDHLTILNKEGEPKMCEYVPGWDDRKVSETVNRNFTAAHTAGIRTELYGHLRAINKRKSIGCEKQLDRFALEIVDIQSRLNHVETMLNMRDD